MSPEQNYKFPKETQVVYAPDIIQFSNSLTNTPGLSLVKTEESMAAASLLVDSLDEGNVVDKCFEVLKGLNNVPFTHVLYTHTENGTYTISLMDERIDDVERRLVGKFVMRIYDYNSPYLTKLYPVEGKTRLTDFAVEYFHDYEKKKYIAGDVDVISRGSNLGMLLLYLVDIFAAEHNAFRVSIDLSEDNYISSMLLAMRHKLYKVQSAASASYAYYYDPQDILIH